jgi:hypothetical protein
VRPALTKLTVLLRLVDDEHGEVIVLQPEDDELRIITLKRRLKRAQRRVRQYINPGRSLADELITERHYPAKLKPDRRVPRHPLKRA